MADSDPINKAAESVESIPDEKPRQEWRKVFLAALDEELRRNRLFRQYLETCVRCGICGDKCPVYMGTADPAEMPPERARKAFELMPGIFDFFSPNGFRARRLDESVLFDWFYTFYRCLGCRRCAVFCPMGIDTSVISISAKRVMARIGLAGERHLDAALADSYDRGVEHWLDAAAGLERGIFNETGVAVQAPVNQKNRDVLLVGAASDLFTHTGTMAGYAKMFHAAGISWTVSSDVGNPDHPAMLVDGDDSEFGWHSIEFAIESLQPRLVVWGETGLGWRLAREGCARDPKKMSRFDFLERKTPVHIHEFVAELLEKGSFDGKLNPTANRGEKVTYHDPCHLARGGGIVEEPRAILRACVYDFREMDHSCIRNRTLCCGAGCSRYTDESLLRDGGGPGMNAYLDLGVNVLATSCDTCKSAMAKLPEERAKRKHRVAGVMELFGAAITPYLKDLTGKGSRT